MTEREQQIQKINDSLDYGIYSPLAQIKGLNNVFYRRKECD